MTSKPINTRGFFFFSEFIRAACLDVLERGATVSRFAFDNIQFEVRITKVGDQSLPRVTDAQAQKGKR